VDGSGSCSRIDDGVGGIGEVRFIADVMLGKLAKWMRALGWDVRYENDIQDSRLLREAEKEGRVVLTRDSRMVEEWRMANYLLLSSDDPVLQLKEVLSHFERPVEDKFLGRCLVCNVTLERRLHSDVRGLVPEYIYRVHDRFSRCPKCGRVFWRGSHYRRMKEKMREFIDGR